MKPKAMSFFFVFAGRDLLSCVGQCAADDGVHFIFRYRARDFSDWKTVDGITLPFHQELSVNGQLTATMTINSYEVNPTIRSEDFPEAVGEDAVESCC